MSSSVCALMLIPRSAMVWSVIRKFSTHTHGQIQRVAVGLDPLENYKWLKASLEFLVRTSLEG